MRVTDYHQANLLQAETANRILVEFNGLNNDIFEALKVYNKEIPTHHASK